ncbi:MAG: hypothetical protein PHT91_01080 [Candidatus Nanoarchaeia archaeon]|nr:hypothetical protein [Candidatus Nanoarchaeia archaeon]
MILLNLIKFSCNKDVATNKIALTNPHIDKNKWYQGYKEDYKNIFDILNKNNKEIFDFILNNNDNILPHLAEIKIIIENNGDLELIKKINTILDSIKYSENSFIYDDFNNIYNTYENVFEGLK